MGRPLSVTGKVKRGRIPHKAIKAFWEKICPNRQHPAWKGMLDDPAIKAHTEEEQKKRPWYFPGCEAFVQTVFPEAWQHYHGDNVVPGIRRNEVEPQHHFDPRNVAPMQMPEIQQMQGMQGMQQMNQMHQMHRMQSQMPPPPMQTQPHYDPRNVAPPEMPRMQQMQPQMLPLQRPQPPMEMMAFSRQELEAQRRTQVRDPTKAEIMAQIEHGQKRDNSYMNSEQDDKPLKRIVQHAPIGQQPERRLWNGNNAATTMNSPRPMQNPVALSAPQSQPQRSPSQPHVNPMFVSQGSQAAPVQTINVDMESIAANIDRYQAEYVSKIKAYEKTRGQIEMMQKSVMTMVVLGRQQEAEVKDAKQRLEAERLRAQRAEKLMRDLETTLAPGDPAAAVPAKNQRALWNPRPPGIQHGETIDLVSSPELSQIALPKSSAAPRKPSGTGNNRL